MRPMKADQLRAVVALLAVIALLAVAIPVLAASPSPMAAPAAATPMAAPGATAAPVKPDKTAKPDKGSESAISLKGTVVKAVDAKGRPTYTMTVGGTTWELSAGPPWYWGDASPLNAFVGQSVTVAGTTRTGGNEIDVETVNGTALHGPGKPPWAGGPWAVGSSHPGWKDWMAGGKPGNGHGHDSAPGQLKKTAPAS